MASHVLEQMVVSEIFCFVFFFSFVSICVCVHAHARVCVVKLSFWSLCEGYLPWQAVSQWKTGEIYIKSGV